MKNIFVISLKQGVSRGGLWPFYLKTTDFVLLFLFYFVLMQEGSRVLLENA